MNDELFAALAASLQELSLPRERVQRASAVALPINERIGGAALRRMTLDDIPPDFTTLELKSAAS